MMIPQTMNTLFLYLMLTRDDDAAFSHAVFFRSQPHFIPLIHPGNYLRAFHSPPHMRPPMCLQYAIWSAASNGHPKYGLFHDALYRRARQYLEADELKVIPPRAHNPVVFSSQLASNQRRRAKENTSSRLATRRLGPSSLVTRPALCYLPGHA